MKKYKVHHKYNPDDILGYYWLDLLDPVCLICGSMSAGALSRYWVICDNCFKAAEIIPISKAESKDLIEKLKKVANE